MVRVANLASSGFLLVIASGCHSVHLIKGHAPEDGSCEVVKTVAFAPPSVSRQTVRGDFAITHIAGGLFPPSVDIVAYCNGVKVKELKGVAPLRAGKEIDLGNVAP